MKVEDLKSGAILSEISFFKVKEVKASSVIVSDEHGNDIEISHEYVEQVLISADYYVTEEKKTMTELAEIFISNPRIAMTVAFFKKDKEKTKKAYEAEKKALIQKVQEARVSDVPILLDEMIENPLSRVIPGELRVMKGRHYGNVDELGRIQFVDMEQAKEPGKDYDSRLRQVDPRTIKYLIINKVKYILK